MHSWAGVLSLSGVLLLASGSATLAQSWPPWADDVFGRRFHYAPHREPELNPQRFDRRDVDRERRDARDADREVRDGGPRPAISAVAPAVVPFPYDFAANSIVIDTGRRKLYYVLPDNRAFEYRIGVGRDGFSWNGTETVSRKQAWPDWHPPPEMRERDPKLPEKMTGGIKNPLGAMALYLGNTLYRIHGTNDPKSIGRAESSGCFRMLNSAVLHLASVTEIGTPVTVVSSMPKGQAVSRAPAPTPMPPAAAPPEPSATPPLPPASTPPAPSASSPPEPPQAASPPEPSAPARASSGPEPSPASASSPAAPPAASDYRSLRDYTLQTR